MGVALIRKGYSMGTHINRKDAALDGLLKAKGEGVQYSEIAKAIDVPAGALRTFVKSHKLGPDRLKAFLAWLVREGYCQSDDRPELKLVHSMDICQMIADRLMSVAKTLLSDVDINIKTEEFTALILQYNSSLDTYRASLKKSDQ